MTSLHSSALLATTGALGVDWSVLTIVVVGIAALMAVVRGVGVVAARTHPSPEPPKATVALQLSATEGAPTPELLAVLTAAATTAVGSSVRVLEIQEVSPTNTLVQQAWSREGRREIYISHRLR